MWISAFVPFILASYFRISEGLGCMSKTDSFTIASEEGVPVMKCQRDPSTPMNADDLLNVDENEEAELYWRDFNGPPVPEDAVLAGTQNNAGSSKLRNVYLGQMLLNLSKNNYLLPVAIFNDSNTVYSSFAGPHHADKHVKILCSNARPEKIHELLNWVPYGTPQKYKTGWVVAGVEDSVSARRTLYFGRTMINQSFIVGKALFTSSYAFTMYYPWLDQELRSDSVEVLMNVKETT